MKYDELTMTAKAGCVYNYLCQIVPYGSDDYDGFDEIEYSIRETIATGLFSIDEDGNWYDEEGERL